MVYQISNESNRRRLNFGRLDMSEKVYQKSSVNLELISVCVKKTFVG